MPGTLPAARSLLAAFSPFSCLCGAERFICSIVLPPVNIPKLPGNSLYEQGAYRLPVMYPLYGLSEERPDRDPLDLRGGGAIAPRNGLGHAKLFYRRRLYPLDGRA